MVKESVQTVLQNNVISEESTLWDTSQQVEKLTTLYLFLYLCDPLPIYGELLIQNLRLDIFLIGLLPHSLFEDLAAGYV